MPLPAISSSDNLPPIKSNGFSYSASTGFTYDGIHREPIHEVQALLFPDSVKGKRAQKQASERAHRTCTKKWYLAQLKHYGITHKASMTVATLHGALREAVEQGHCTTLPVSVTSIETKLKEEFQTANAAHLATLNQERLDRFDVIQDPAKAAIRDSAGEETMAEHRAFMKKLPGGKRAQNPTGSYFVTCKEIEDQWPDSCDQDGGFEFTIRDDTERTHKRAGKCWAADFDFGILEGMMRFWVDGEDSVEDYDAPDDDDSHEEEEEEEEESPPKKRKRSSGKQQQKLRKKANKKATKKATNARKLHFHWRGRETGEGEIQLDYDGSQKGYIEFTDDKFTAFKGEFSGSFVGQRVVFNGYKVGVATGGGRSNYWSDFGERAYEYARVNRWR